MDERLQFVARRLEDEPMADLCREFGISRKTGYKIFDRYQQCGVLKVQKQRSREASVLVSPCRPWTTLRLTSSVSSSQLKSPNGKPMISLGPETETGRYQNHGAVRLSQFPEDQTHFREAEDELRKALALDPNSAYAHVTLCWFYADMGKTDDMLNECSRAAEIDPFSPIYNMSLTLAYNFSHDHGRVLQ
jgi:hypothetical protein